MALGIVFLFLQQEYTSDAFTYLFGSIIAVKKIDIWMALGVALVTLLLWPVWQRWAYASFDRELAESDRLPVSRDDYLLSLLIAGNGVVGNKIVGIVLIAAFLVIPAATARLISKTFRIMTLFSVFIGVSSAIIGLFLSYFLDIPSGAAIILFQALLFFFIFFIVTFILKSHRSS